MDWPQTSQGRVLRLLSPRDNVLSRTLTICAPLFLYVNLQLYRYGLLTLKCMRRQTKHKEKNVYKDTPDNGL